MSLIDVKIVRRFGLWPIYTNLIVTVVVANRSILQHSRVNFIW